MQDNGLPMDDNWLEKALEDFGKWAREVYPHTEFGKQQMAEWRAEQEQKKAARRKINRHYMRRWTKANADKVRAYHHRRRIAKKENSFTGADVKQHYRAQKGRCWWCGATLGKNYHVDHRVPIARGGKNTPENICLACPQCNLSKGAKLPGEWSGRLL